MLRTAIVTVSVAASAVLASPPAATATVSPWPAVGQASYQLGSARIASNGVQRPVPIASLAKMMTAYLVLTHHPIKVGEPGFALTVTARDVADTARRAANGESYVAVRAGERLTEAQALAALLLPSANNIAVMLARAVAGTVADFVRVMNAKAAALGLRHTHYADPSGIDPRTVSTAADQTRLIPALWTYSVIRKLVGMSRSWIPVEGTIHNTDVLLGTDGFVGIKTGSMSQSGGCFMFRSLRRMGDRMIAMVGVVLGQPGADLITAGQWAAKRLVDTVAPRPA